MPIATRGDLSQYLQADLQALGIPRYRWYFRVTNRTAYFERLLRLTEYRLAHRRTLLGRVWAKISVVRLRRLGEVIGVSIHPGCFGPGLSIAHPGGIVVNPHTRIGAGCRIHQNVTIGSVKDAAPVIGDDAWLGPGAVLYGAITLGDHIAVGANSVVGDDFPGGVTVAGAPARVIRDSGY